MPIDHVIIFTDFSTLLVPTILTEATIGAVAGMKNFQIDGICVRNFQKYNHLRYRHSRTVLKTTIKAFFDKNQRQKYLPTLPINIEKLGRKHRFKILIPPDNDINHKDFIRQIKTEIKPTVALSFYCLQKFSPELLQAFEYTVNYHNGSLPAYRGLMASCWSLYQQDSSSGYTFHRINEKIDKGNSLIEGKVPVQTDSRAIDLEYMKAYKAAKDIPDLLQIMMKRKNGVVQNGEGNYFSKKDWQEIIIINVPAEYSSIELTKRLQAFGSLLINIKGVWYNITKFEKLSAAPNHSKAIYFETSDGVIMRPSRYCFLPFFMYKILKKTGWKFSSETIVTDAQW